MSSAICVTPTYCLFVCESRGVLPQPSISVSPGGVIPVGGNVTIWCWHQHLGLTFLLYKDEDRNYLAHTDTAGSEAEFPITSARREHGGNYTCRYHDKSGIYSEASDPVQIIVGSDPKPSISVSPGGVIPMGGNVTIQCWHQLLDMRILLYKAGDGNYLNYTDPAGSEAEFPITSARREHGEVAYSEPSDPMQIIVASEGPSPTPSQAPGGLSESWNPAEGTFSRERAISAAPIGQEPRPMGAAGVAPAGRGSAQSPLATPLPRSWRNMPAASQETPEFSTAWSLHPAPPSTSHPLPQP
uniref:Ig-like domain-containing protein n=1 Tax=Chrysemys picta bellii TaxID=8478 RepID=A0A8C3HT37_CHRPI